jgi:hypothetical protein
MRSWTWHRWATAVAVFVAAGLLTGVPTDIVPTSLYQRMTPVLWWNYPVWAVSAILTGLVAATYVRSPGHASDSGFGRITGGGLLSVFAVGCPVCNKLIVALLGVSGALTFWAPVQPLLGLASIGLLGYVFVTRLRRERACPLRSPAPLQVDARPVA